MQTALTKSTLTCAYIRALDGCLKDSHLQGGSRDVKPVGNGSGQVSHDLQPHPPVGLHGIVTVVWAWGSECVGDVIQDQRHVLQATVNEGLHQGHVASEILPTIVLLHSVTGSSPQCVSLFVDAVCRQDACCCHEVTGLNEDDSDTPAVHLLP